jgi:hypothetical protein
LIKALASKKSHKSAPLRSKTRILPNTALALPGSHHEVAQMKLGKDSALAHSRAGFDA